LLKVTGGTTSELYPWWQHHWTTGSVSSAGTTGESPVAVATAKPAATEAPVANDRPPPDAASSPNNSNPGVTADALVAAFAEFGGDCEVSSGYWDCGVADWVFGDLTFYFQGADASHITNVHAGINYGAGSRVTTDFLVAMTEAAAGESAAS
jgi:hypothetical protein